MKTEDLFTELPGEWDYQEDERRITLKEVNKGGIKIEGILKQGSLFINTKGGRRSPVLFEQVYVGEDSSQKEKKLIEYIKAN